MLIRKSGSTSLIFRGTSRDRKVDNGFPETKELKNRVRNVIEPGRDLGHVDRSLKKAAAAAKAQSVPEAMSSIEGGGGRGAATSSLVPEAMPSIESFAGLSMSSTVQGDAVMADISAGPTIPVPAEKCEDCQ
jgi:hypothetical protein